MVSQSLLCPIFAPATIGTRNRSGAASGEFAPVEAEVDEKKRSQGEGDDADGGESVSPRWLQ